jgi:F-box-like
MRSTARLPPTCRTVLDFEELARRVNQLANTTPPQQHASSLKSSPISLLPNELLAEIFLLALPGERFPSPSTTSAPLSLTHVCRDWRRLAEALPELWTCLHLHSQLGDDVLPAQQWLTRSANRPLSLSLSIDFDEKPHQDIIDTFSQHSSRWERVRFEFRSLQCPLMYNLDMASGNIPLLSSFEFHARDVSSDNITPITSLLSTAPSLRDVTWVDDLADAPALLGLPLPRLSRLSLSMHNGSLDYLQLLNLCTNLEHIRIRRPLPEIRPPQLPLTLSKLTSLNIAHDLTAGLLDHLVLPALKHVRVHKDSGPPRRFSRTLANMPGSPPDDTAGCWDPTPFLNLVERSGCAIESLGINAAMKEGDLSRCLQACSSSLKHLSLSGGLALGVDVIHALTPKRVLRAIQSSSLDENDDIWTCACPGLSELTHEALLPSSLSLAALVQTRLGLMPHATSSPSSPPHITPLAYLRAHYQAGHQDIARLRELALAANGRRSDAFQLSIIETRIGNVRGSSATGRQRLYPPRLRAAASR